MESNTEYIVIDKELVMEDIISCFKSYSDKKRAKEIKSECIEKFCKEDDLFQSAAKRLNIETQVTKLLMQDKKQGDESLLVFKNGKYQKRKKKTLTTIQPSPVGSAYIGAAGECAVLSELMFHGYNANRMMIDDGIDIIASKSNLFFYIQVKTATMDPSGRLMAKISSERFGYHVDSQLWYVIVTRIKGRKGSENLFFVFSSKDIRRMIQQGSMKEGQQDIIIKIRYNELSGIPYAYDDNQEDISYYMNNFQMI